jgi:DNA-binding MarR family transcriptional regulator/N-acetylglutamate synthase-like GNAT family acetyltransferase
MSETITAVRAFNRLYTGLVGALDARFLGTDLSLPEARLLFEIAASGQPILAAELQATLKMDAGFVSRVLARFATRGWIVRARDGQDARQRPISLTDAGHAAFDDLDRRQRMAVETMVQRLDPAQQRDLVAALGTVRALLAPDKRQGFVIRPFRTGDLALLAARQSILYHESYGWGGGLELIESEVTTAFLRDFKPGREQCWIAELNGAMAGSVILTDEGDGVARLRLLYVESMARGLGIGGALVDRCIEFARDAGYQSITLWTHTILDSARRLYAARGFRIVETAMHESFGVPIQGETWQLTLERIAIRQNRLSA